MTVWLAAVALIAAFLIQNIDEVLAGGPPVPPFLRDKSPAKQAAVRRRAMMIVSLLVPVLLIASLAADWVPGALMIAGALGANAIAQIGHSLWRRRIMPGTVTGAALMLPAAIWLAAALGPVHGKPYWAALGVVAMVPALIAIWCLAARTD